MKAAIGITAVLAAFPSTFALSPAVQEKNEHQQTHPLLSGSVCRVRDSLDFLDPKERAKVTFRNRLNIAKAELEVGPTCHITNGDEQNVPQFVGQFHKSLPHDKNGVVDPAAYQKLLDCVESGDINVCDEVPSGAKYKDTGARMVNPLGGSGHQVEGADSDNIFIATPSAVLSAELAAQQIEVYWMALLRDVSFSQFAIDGLAKIAAENLSRLPAFKGLAIPKGEDGTIDPVRDLFRTDWPGVTTGPVVSQFLLSNWTLDGTEVEPKIRTLIRGNDYMTAYSDWLDVQNGITGPSDFVDEPLFIRNGRDLSALAFVDLIYSEALRAAVIMFEQGVLSNNGPYAASARQSGFATFGEPHILTALAASSSATRHAWYAKWQVHRVLRPEAYGGLVHNTITGSFKTPLDSSILENTELLTRVEANNKEQNGGEKTFLLPMSVAEGSPVHPAYPSGHAINVGAFITTLKAFLGFEKGQQCFPALAVASDDGTKLVDFVPAKGETLDACIGKEGRTQRGVTYEGELNKLAANVIIGRSHIGVHYRMDGVFGALMGEAGAIRRLQQELGGLPEARKSTGSIPEATYKFRLYSGKMIEIFGPELYMLDGQTCKGKFTGDDFCDVAKDSDLHRMAKKVGDGQDIYYKEL